jgi:hypothetical protein
MGAKNLQSAAEVIDELGGIAAVAALIGTTYRAAANWKSFNAFPPKTFIALTSALEAKGLCAPASLWGMIGVEAAE